MQLDDKFSSDSLCFIISQIDDFKEEKVEQYLEDNPGVERDFGFIEEGIVALKNLEKSAEQFISGSEANEKENKKAKKDVNLKIRKLSKEIKKIEDPLPIANKKRKQNADHYASMVNPD